MSNIRTVAKIAGVSISTVSRALSHPNVVSEKTRAKIQDAIKQANYRPNMLARNFRSARSYSIVVLVPDISNPFFSKVIRGIEEIALTAGYAVLLGDTRGSSARENQYIKLFETRQAEGLIQLSTNIPDALLESDGETIVNACECLPDVPCPTVTIDNAKALKDMVEHLVSMGHKKIGLVKGPNNSPLTQDRLAGYKQALNDASIAFDEKLVHDGDFSLDSGMIAAQHYLKLTETPSAICCMNDEMAIGLIRGLKSNGLRVPEDISVSGFDDIDFARFSDPPLTTISQPAEDIGRESMEILIKLLEKKEVSERNIKLPTRLIMRQSTCEKK